MTIDYLAIKNITDSVLAGIIPTDKERTRQAEAAKYLIDRVHSQAAETGIPIVDVVQCGSSARETWLPGSNDIDIFIQFSEDTPLDEMKAMGLALGRSIVPDWREAYAEHPYICAVHDGYDVDLVPCYKLEPKNGVLKIRSAVDRTPFHNRYVKDKIAFKSKILGCDVANEIRLFKQFAKGIGVYGSEHKTNGMSGYLCELLVLNGAGFVNTLIDIADWKENTVLDPEHHIDGKLAMTYAIEKLDPLVLIDPVDGKRNVAAAMSAQKYWELVDGCRRFLESPSIEFFNSKKVVEPLTVEELTDLEIKRGTRFVIIKGARQPGMHDDILYPQLRRAEKSALAALDRAGFRTFKSDVYADETSFSFVFEMDVLELPNIKRVLGPPLKMRDACKNYRDLYPNAYVCGDRLATTVDREYVHAELFLFDGFTNEKFGNVPTGGEACKESINEAFNDEFGRFMRTFLRE